MTRNAYRVGRRLARWLSLERGQTMAEYALILGAVLLVAIGAFQLLGPQISVPVSATADLFASIP